VADHVQRVTRDGDVRAGIPEVPIRDTYKGREGLIKKTNMPERSVTRNDV